MRAFGDGGPADPSCAEAALQKAMVVFWERAEPSRAEPSRAEQGYEGASLADLTEAMGISRKSMYAAYGNKEDLFRLVLQRYTEGPGAYILEALRAPTARPTPSRSCSLATS
ncbi:TetR/AcrR family transcriptional regulator [Amycolatopsis sp. NPDC101161]|uniref:TetR/AcrR family transcriptional regulator n=1 Tax=Amycolatopsis sp. NPDC101161 TaxID=3363940 RepID=UPI0038043B58